jgi:phage terminase small subunit
MSKANDLSIEDYFKRYKTHLSQISKSGESFDIDDVALMKLSEWEKIYQDMKKDCEDNGYTQITQSGYSQIRAEYSIMVKAQDFILSLGKKFGLTPADRSDIFKGKPPKKEVKKGFNLTN